MEDRLSQTVGGIIAVKINEDNIDYNLQRLLDEYVASPFEYAEQSDDADHQRLLTLGYVRGAIDFANELKKVLRA